MKVISGITIEKIIIKKQWIMLKRSWQKASETDLISDLISFKNNLFFFAHYKEISLTPPKCLDVNIFVHNVKYY